jgi:hypothetical protein
MTVMDRWVVTYSMKPKIFWSGPTLPKSTREAMTDGADAGTEQT